jgi:hypothetical protein
MNDSSLRTLFQKTGSGTTISMSDGWGKSSFTPGFTGLAGTTFTVLWSTVNTYPVINSLYINTNGTWDQRDNNGVQISGTWGSPSVSGIGSNYWVKFTLNSVSGSTGSATATTGWQQLNAARNVDLLKLNGGTITYSGNYTVQIASDSGGSNIVATASNFILTSSRA